MALRIHTYSGLLYQELVRNEAPGVADGRLPPLLPVVLYNGTEPWTAARRMSGLVAPGAPWLAPYQPVQGYFLLDLRRVADDDLPGRNLLRAVAALEQSRSFEDVLRVRDALQLWLQDPRAAELQRAFVDWMRQIAERVAPAGAVVPPVRTLEEVRMTLVERAAEWPKQWLREGREQGLAEGREQGLEQGIEQGVDQQRALLCRHGGGTLRCRYRRSPDRRVGADHRPGSVGRDRRLAGAMRHRRRVPRPPRSLLTILTPPIPARILRESARP